MGVPVGKSILSLQVSKYKTSEQRFQNVPFFGDRLFIFKRKPYALVIQFLAIINEFVTAVTVPVKANSSIDGTLLGGGGGRVRNI